MPHVGVVASVIAEKKNDEDRGQVGAGDGGGDAGADYAEHREARMAEHEKVVADGIDEVGGDECEGYGANEVHTLERTAKREVEKQGYEAEGEGEHVGAGEEGDVGGDAQPIEEMWKRPDCGKEGRRDGEAEIDAID